MCTLHRLFGDQMEEHQLALREIQPSMISLTISSPMTIGNGDKEQETISTRLETDYTDLMMDGQEA